MTKTGHPKSQIRNAIKKIGRRMLILYVVMANFIFAGFLMGFLFIYHKDKIMPNTHISHYSLGGKNRDEVSALIDGAIDVYSREKVIITYEGQKKEFGLDELGVSFDKRAIVDDIFLHNSGLSFGYFLSNLYEDKRVSAQYFIDAEKFTAAIDEAYGDIEVAPVDARLIFTTGGVSKVESQPGSLIDRSKLIFDLRQNLDNFTIGEIVLHKVDSSAVVSTDALDEVYEKSKNLIGKQINFVFGYDKWTVSGKSFYDLLEYYPSGQTSVDFASFDMGQPLVVKIAQIGDYGGRGLSLSLNEERIDDLLNSMAGVIDKSARDATLRFEGGKVVEFASAQDGQQLRKADAKKLIVRSLNESLEGDSKTVSVELPVSITKAKIANRQINDLGIRELVGSGVSYFAGSIPNRVHNIGLGASFINGILVKPGDTFSFNELVGPVSAQQGFRQAYVIKSGRTVLDDGGGICQVSTTVFRAALNSGLPIVKRTAHAYRVSYYEQKGFKAGLDATIFSPTVDLQFKNDTGAHLLVQATVDKANSRLQVDIYGTRDGRITKLSEPVVTNVIPAPEPQYIDDPTLPKGTVKQVDFAASGATSVFNRKVYKGEVLIIDDTFKSVFRPWQAVYLVGTAG